MNCYECLKIGNEIFWGLGNNINTNKSEKGNLYEFFPAWNYELF